jgi:hypothetical protein
MAQFLKCRSNKVNPDHASWHTSQERLTEEEICTSTDLPKGFGPTEHSVSFTHVPPLSTTCHYDPFTGNACKIDDVAYSPADAMQHVLALPIAYHRARDRDFYRTITPSVPSHAHLGRTEDYSCPLHLLSRKDHLKVYFYHTASYSLAASDPIHGVAH